ncbi:MAG: 3-dehydroquinate synthase [Phycisphaerales bacterium]
MPVVTVNLPHHRYDITIEPTVLDRLGAIVRNVAPHARCILISDEHVMALHGEHAAGSLKHAGYDVVRHILHSGENHKNLDSVKKAYNTMLDAKLERRSPVIALGGGIVGDVAGFIASTYLRGVPFIQCPTSLLAMVDASVGGKVGVNVPQGKNLIGAFYQPMAVVIDPLVLQTLPPRELRCGMAECVKHAVIRDAGKFEWLDENWGKIQAMQPGTLTELVAWNVAIKARVVEADEKETGERAHLNFGHTFAHAIEAAGGYGVIEHGEAVALGMVAATKLATDAKRCPPPPELLDPLIALLTKIGLPVKAKLAPVEKLMAAMTLDKKVADSKIRLVLPDRMGAASVVRDATAAPIEAAWRFITG